MATMNDLFETWRRAWDRCNARDLTDDGRDALIGSDLAPAENRVCETPAETVADLALKARVLDVLIEGDPGEDDPAGRLTKSILADIERLAFA
jgi:hypothetical protein